MRRGTVACLLGCAHGRGTGAQSSPRTGARPQIPPYCLQTRQSISAQVVGRQHVSPGLPTREHSSSVPVGKRHMEMNPLRQRAPMGQSPVKDFLKEKRTRWVQKVISMGLDCEIKQNHSGP